jgi:hypothetical protein
MDGTAQMDDWPAPTGPQTEGWVIPESLQQRRPPAGQQPATEQGVPIGQPPSGQTPYGQPPYGQPAYQPPQYEQPYQQPPYGNYPMGGPGTPAWMTVQPVRNRRRGIWISIACVVALMVGLAVVIPVVQHRGLLAAGGGPGHRLQLPDSVDSNVRISTPSAVQLGVDAAAQVKATAPNVWEHPLVGLYGPDATGAPTLIFLGGDGDSNPLLGSKLRAGSAKVFVDGFMVGAHVASSTSFPTGHFGGVLRCGLVGGASTACVWADESTVGTLFVLHASSLAAAAAETLSFREVSER